MAKQCERPGCKEPAIAAYFLDSAELLMTLENYVPVDGMQVNGLCRRHADALVVPRGWRIEDKRENVPRLFPVTPPSEKPKAKDSAPKKSESKKNRAKLPRPSIFDDLKNEKKAEERSKREQFGPKGPYECPVYKYSCRTDKYFVFMANLKCPDNKPPNHFVLRGTCILCNT